MKKYKLIKEYPNSPRLNSILIERGQNSYYTINSKTIYYSLCPRFYPEFWEEVVEKDYEILSILLKRADKHHVRDLDTCDSDNYITALLKCDGNSIHSVKRLSDGEIFTVGDEITTCVSSNYASIYSFSIVNNYLKIEHTHSFRLDKKVPGTPPGGHLYLISKKKKPLFKTKDGVDIFKDDNYWVVSKKYIYESTCTSEYEYQAFDLIEKEKDLEQYNWDNFWAFSTKEAAEEYIIRNKPCLSINDICNIKGLNMTNFVPKLKEFIKKL